MGAVKNACRKWLKLLREGIITRMRDKLERYTNGIEEAESDEEC